MKQALARGLRENGLSIVTFALFLLFLVGQSVTGWMSHNEERTEHGQAALSYVAFLASGEFGESVFENWESEFLQMGAFVLLTVFLHQKGSAESKDPERRDKVDEDPARSRDPEAPLPVRMRGVWVKVYSHSLGITFMLLFVVCFALHAVSGARAYNDEQILHGGARVTPLGYLATSRFWFESFQNWQSEFLAVGAMVVLSIFLRQRGSPESKAVAEPHRSTGKG
jgi:hypothetical protein